MSEILQRFGIQYAKFDSTTSITVIAIWLLVVGCTIASIVGQPLKPRQRAFWCAIVIAAPIVGLLAYLPFSVRKEDLPQIFRLRKPQKRRREALAVDATRDHG